MKIAKKILVSALLLCAMGVNSGKKEANTKYFVENLNISKNEVILEDFEEGIQVNAVSSKLKTRAKSAFLMDYDTKSILFSENEETRLPIASMCKIMTLLLSFEAIDAGELSMDEQICISERASSMGGSQVFLEANAKYSVRNLIKSIIVCSANDSCMAMAERISGDESLFVDKMNEKAQELGAYNTLFANCTGLPKEPQYSCAKDVAIMLRALLEHEEYYEFGKVWLDRFEHPEGRYTEITNTNKLVRFYDGCDGGKTGFTNEAGFCLAATAKRNNMRVISVVIGEENSTNRFEDVKTLFDYAFANYKNETLAKAEVPLEEKVVVQGGKKKTIEICPAKDVYILTKKGEKGDYRIESYFEKVKAPIEKGDCVGELVVFKDGVEINRTPLVALESVGEASIFDWFIEISRNWNA